MQLFHQRRESLIMIDRTLLVALLVAFGAESSGGEQCAQGVVTRYSVRGGYNASGHWKGEVRVEQDVQLRGRSGLQLDVEAWPSSCEAINRDVLVVRTQDISLPTQSPSRPTREGYQVIPGFGSYKFHGKHVSWDEANNTCVAEGAHLLVIDTPEEASEIQKIIDKMPSPTNWFHIGFQDKLQTRNFITVLGQPLLSTNFHRWAPAEPHRTTEFCGGISKVLGLVDIHCTNHHVMFICEEY